MMNIKNLTNYLIGIANACPLVNSSGYGDVYDELNNIGSNQYGHINISVDSCTSNGGITTYVVRINYADRLLQDASNTLSVQSDGYVALRTIINAIANNSDISVGNYTINYFEQQFADYCAGAYADVQMSVADGIGGCAFYDVPAPEDIYALYKAALAEINHLNGVITEKDAIISEQAEQIDEQTHTIANLSETIDQQGEMITEQGQTIAEQGQTIAEQGQTISTALTDLNATNGTDETSLASATEVTETSRQAIAEAISAKGVDVPEGTGLVEMASKVEQIQQGGGGIVGDEGLEGEPFQFSEYFTLASCGLHGYLYSVSSYIRDKVRYVDCDLMLTPVGANSFRKMPNLQWLRLTGTTSMTSSFARDCSNLRSVIMPSCVSVGATALYGTSNLIELVVGTLTTYTANALGTDKAKLRKFFVGQGTDISITITFWSATAVIAEGEAAQLELIANARAGLLERVQDHTGEGLVRTITAAWVGTLSESEYDSVVDALDELMTDFADKGWILQG